MEKDDEVKGGGNSYDFGARMYDSRVGRWWSLDPLTYAYPNLSSYSFAANSPLQFIDFGGSHLRDAYGNIIYSFANTSPVYDEVNKLTIMEVYVYANDGSKHHAILYVPDDKDFEKEKEHILYFCHGYTQMDCKISPSSGSPIEGLLKGDRSGILPEKGLEEAKSGDIAIFRVTKEMISSEESDFSEDDLGEIIHTAILNEDGTFSTKNGRSEMLQTNATLESLTKLYGNNVSFTDKAENINLQSLNTAKDFNGIVYYTEDEVKEALNKENKKNENKD